MTQTALYSQSAPYTGRYLLADLWRNSLQDYVSNDPGYGYRQRTDFVTESLKTSDGTANQITGTTAVTAAEGWTGQDAVAAGGTYTVSIVEGDGGYMRLASGTTTNNQGVEVGRTMRQFALPSHSTTPSSRFVAQFRINNGTAADWGLLMSDAAYNVPIAGTNAIADVGYIGFRVNDAGDLLFVAKSAAAGTADSKTLIAAANFTKTGVHTLGFAVNADKTVDVDVDGVWYRNAVSTFNQAALPTGNLCVRFFGTCGSGTTAPQIDVDQLDLFAANQAA